MTIDDMRYVLKIAEMHSISKAAKALFITQPTLSQRLQKVENELDMKLFERDRFGEITTTEAGSRFCTECEHILSHWRRLQEDLKKMKGNRNITLGIPVRTGYQMVSGLQVTLNEMSAGISVTFEDHPNWLLEEKVASGELDIALIRQAAPNGKYDRRILFENEPGIYLREESPLWEKVYYHEGEESPYIDLTLLADEPMVGTIASKDHRTRLWTDSIFKQIPNMQPRFLYTVPNIFMFRDYQKRGLASFILPTVQFTKDIVRLEPEYSIPYVQYFVKNEHTSKEIADTIYHILVKQIRSNLV